MYPTFAKPNTNYNGVLFYSSSPVVSQFCVLIHDRVICYIRYLSGIVNFFGYDKKVCNRGVDMDFVYK